MIKVQKLTKIYKNHVALSNVSFNIDKNESICILGPSGSGKSTVMKCINNIITPDSGSVSMHNISPSKITTIFQHFNLFANKNVIDNLTYALRIVHKYDKVSALQKAHDTLDKVNISAKYANHYPHQLSGGQKQRVAIARALCVDPEVVFFDEPTSALDPENSAEIISVIRNLIANDITVVVVTHELSLARSVAKRILFFHDGKLLEDSSAEQFWQQPQTSEAKNFLSRAVTIA